MNDVLRAFMHAKLAGLLRGEETIEPFKENWQARQRMPDWGIRRRSGRRRRRRGSGSEGKTSGEEWKYKKIF
jgi:hypothetical protein